MIDKRKFYRDTYMTERQIEILKILRESKNISEAAKKLKVSITTIYTSQDDLMRIVKRALKTVKEAQKLGLVNEDEIMKLFKTSIQGESDAL